jgi:RNA polymerase sigma factor (sigma-70 family)
LLDRYRTGRDEAAFEALVARHGPMVLGVCRRALDDPHAVEDAFQATFLVLVRRAGSLGPRDAIGHWLYGVACRVALRARCETARRRAREVPVGRAVNLVHAVTNGSEEKELARILVEELLRLPPKYRAPVVLCYLEGLTHEEAALQLRWPIGSVKGRLARAKELLRGRLARRGLVPTAGLAAAAVGCHASAAVPAMLRHAATQAALAMNTGGVAAEAVSASVVRLIEGVHSAMFLTKLKVTATVLAACGGLTLGASALSYSLAEVTARPTDAQVAMTQPGDAQAGVRVALDQEQAVSRPVCWTGAHRRTLRARRNRSTNGTSCPRAIIGFAARPDSDRALPSRSPVSGRRP